MNNWQTLLTDLDEEEHCSAELIEELQTVREELPDIAEVLERIYEDGERHRAEIRDMMMRSDPLGALPRVTERSGVSAPIPIVRGMRRP